MLMLPFDEKERRSVLKKLFAHAVFLCSLLACVSVSAAAADGGVPAGVSEERRTPVVRAVAKAW